MNENIKKLVKLLGKKKYLYISGNGAGGKTSFSKALKEYLEKQNKVVNLISTDDFITNTKVRNNSVCEWTYEGENFSGRYTSCCIESYFWNFLNSILFSLKNGLDVYYKPKRGGEILLSSKADLTIIEGIGTAFLEKNFDSVGFWFECNKETEIFRRTIRDGITREIVESKFMIRDSQFKANVLPFKTNFDYEINTNYENFKIKKI